MNTVVLQRLETSDQGTFGEMTLPNGVKLMSLELPWRDVNGDGRDDASYSCVRAGTYDVGLELSPRFKQYLYRLSDAQVAPRKGVLIHGGNWAGDVKKGLRSSVEGCILVGKRRGTICGQQAVLDSQLALAKLHLALERKPFRLEIHPVKPGANP